ncbi:MAG TPA: glycosyltransferase family 4 protein [Steroidobacteraceae bacterium]|nr:glycosyltransferase family 4 protein [Steroidobacteraceae bacterium]
MSDSVSSAALQRGASSTQPLAAQPRDAGTRSRERERAVKGRRVLIIVENLPCPFDRRVWQEARTLAGAGYAVSIICPKGPGYEESFQSIDGIDIHRHSLPREADGALGYALEYGVALTMEFWLSLKIFFGRGFDIIHACNPPDTIFIIGGFFKIFGKKFVFDHHDINPELYEAKFGKRGWGHKLLSALERLTFKTADMVISTNESYRSIAIGRGGKNPRDVFVVRSGPDLARIKFVPPNPALKKGRRYLVGYVGVMGKQEGIDLLLRAVQTIVQKMGRTDIQFGLVGGGTELAAMKTLAKQLGVADYVTFTGRAPDAELLEMLNTADICVNPDRANDMNDRSTMNKVMEYMALGKPMVQFDLTEGRVSAGEASWYARPNDVEDLAEKLVALLGDEQQRARMGAIGRERIERVLAWQHEAPRLIAAYEHLIGDQPIGERQ